MCQSRNQLMIKPQLWRRRVSGDNFWCIPGGVLTVTQGDVNSYDNKLLLKICVKSGETDKGIATPCSSAIHFYTSSAKALRISQPQHPSCNL